MTDEVTRALLQSLPLPILPAHGDKDTRGRVLVVAGSAQVPGGAVLAGTAALRAGAGKLRMVATADYATPLAFALPEALVVTAPRTPSGEISPDGADMIGSFLAQTDGVIIGPGMIDETSAALLLERIAAFETDAAFVVDAAALTGSAGASNRLGALAGRLVFTPHAGEMASLLGEPKEAILADPENYARQVSKKWNAVVVLKGSTTWISSPDGRLWVHRAGVQGLGTSGSGDVLAGVIGGLLARGAPPATAAVWGVALHGAAGAALSKEVGELGFLAREIPAKVPKLLKDLR